MKATQRRHLTQQRFFTGILAILTGGWLAAPLDSARATLLPAVVDQSLISSEQAGIAVAADQGWGQTFTVGLAGTLTRIDLQLGRNATALQPLQFELRTLTAGGVPDQSPAALRYSTSIAAASVPVLVTTNNFTVSLDLSGAALAVTPGQQLCLQLTAADYEWYFWTSGYWPVDQYAGGSAVKLAFPDAPNWSFSSGVESPTMAAISCHR